MLDRRSVLRRGAATLGTATLAGAAGCLFDDSGGGGGSDEGGFLAVLPDPTPAVAPNFHAAYSYDPHTLQERLGDTDAMPRIAGRMVEVIGQLSGTALGDVDRLSGQTVRQIGHTGSDVGFVTPRGTDLVVEGSIDVDGAADWFAAQPSLSNLGEDRGYRLFGDEGRIVEAFAVDGDALTFGSRRATNWGPSTILTAAIDGLEDDVIPAAALSPQLADAVGSLPDHTATAATAFDLVAARPDTGSDAYDATASSLVAAGIDADVGEDDTEIVRVLRYRRGRRAAVEDVQVAVDTATADGLFADGDWTVTGHDRTVRIEGTVATATLRETPATLRRAVPVPAYDDPTTPVDPRDLGRDAPPRVSWRAEQLEDGRIAITHGGGPPVENLEVSYTVDGEGIDQAWQGPVEPEDRFTTAQVPDPGSLLDLVWARGTVNETILLRIELPGSDG